MSRLQAAFMLSDKGYADLKKATWAVALTNFAMMLPFIVILEVFAELIKPLSGQEASSMKLWLLFALGVVGAGLIFVASKNDYRKTYIASYMESENTRVAVAEHIRKLPMSVFNSKNLSELTGNIMGDCATAEHVLSHILPQLLANAVSTTVICLMLAVLDWRMALSIYCTLPVAFLLVFLSVRVQRYFGEKHAQAKLEVSDQVQEYIDGIKVIKACDLDGETFSKLEKALRRMKDLAIRFELVTGLFVTGAQVIVHAGVGLTVFVGTYLFAGGSIGLLPLLMFLLVATRIYGPVITELTLLPELLYHQIAVKRMRALQEIAIMEGDAQKEITSYDILFENVGFSYNKGGGESIRDMTVSIPAGGVTALVGPSGSGKSTVARLIARFWDVDRGSVKIGGVDVRSLDPEHLMGYMSFVFQDVVLFNDTVYNNILVGNAGASETEVLAAAQAACCEGFINKLPQGYATVLGENGSTLSGGERQRLSIARALLKNAPLVLLDEATASIDPENEALIQQAISALIKGKTVIVIAHRLKTVAGADKIIVLSEGRVAEEGDHDGLLAQKGLYHRLYNIQRQSMGWSV